MLWTKPPPKRVVTFVLRWSRRMTVSEPDTFGASTSRCARAPKSCVTVSFVSAGVLPAPAPQPASSAASAPRSAGSAAGRRALANVEDTAVAAPHPDAVPVERLVDRPDIEHVVPARQALRQQVREVLAVAHTEEEPGAALRADEPLAPPAVREAALPHLAGEPELDRAHARAALGDGDVDEARGERAEAVDVPAARAQQAGARRGAVDRDAGDALCGCGRRADRHEERVGADRARLRVRGGPPGGPLLGAPGSGSRPASGP